MFTQNELTHDKTAQDKSALGISTEVKIVILAAGEGKRFGGLKQLANFRGKAVLQWVIDAAVTVSDQPLLVLGAQREAILESSSVNTEGLGLCHASNWAEGMSASIGAAVRSPSVQAAQGVLFLLGDQPLIDQDCLECLISAIQSNPNEVIATAYGERAGVPAYFPRAYYEQLSCLKGDMGARQLIAQSAPQVLDLSDKTHDIDRPEDLSV